MTRPVIRQNGGKVRLLGATAMLAVAISPLQAEAAESIEDAFLLTNVNAEKPVEQAEKEHDDTDSDGSDGEITRDVAPVLDLAGSPPVDQDGFALSDEDRVVVTMAGNVDPFGGSIDPFGGTIDPFGGTLDPFGGTIDPFAGSIDPFGGTLDPFGGTINPFHGEVRALWGTIDPFVGGIEASSGTINPFWGNIDPFVGKTDAATGVVLPSYVEIATFWSDFGADWRRVNIMLNRIEHIGLGWTDYVSLGSMIDDLVLLSEDRWGDAVEARTGETFAAAFVDPLFAKFGIGSNRQQGFMRLTKGQRAQLVSEWFDGLNNYTGHNQLDHWMRTVNWNPQLTEIQGGGSDAVIGILDSSIVTGEEFAGNVFHSGGYAATVDGHGVGVASLLIGAHDGEGVMGIAPNASVATYNPFDESGTASWTDIRNGIVSLKTAGASVINMSLGVPGSTFHSEWNNVFTHGQVRPIAKDTVFVIAAGNDGITQTQDIEWRQNLDFGLIVVGAIDALGNISSISNRPGSACLLVNGACSTNNYLRNHFIVAPGEHILMSDGAGGVTRKSGTSFAAPLVSGAITLLHDRWPWLAQDPLASAQIILGSAQDLGEPGIDDVYGVGLLDVEASQSPLAFENLTYYEFVGGQQSMRSSQEIRDGGVGDTWDADGVFLSLFETVGNSQRDFLVPFSSQLVGQQSAINGSSEYFQSYIRKRFVDWSNGQSSTGGFTDVASFSTPERGGWNFAVSATSPTNYLASRRHGEIPHSSVQISSEDGGMKLSGGFGQGAIALLGQESFGLTTDYNAHRGGLNPVLGLASGGGFLDAEIRVAKNMTLAFGLTDRRLDHSENPELTEAERLQLRNARDYEARGFNMRMAYKPLQNVNLSVSFASVDERDGLLGVQSALDGDLRHGSNSKTLTLGGSVDLPHGINIAASATAAMTDTNGGADQNLRTRGAVRSSAYAVSLAKQGVIGKRDRMRLSFTQPLHIESGTLSYNSVEVIDRATGEIGNVSRSFSIADKSRRYLGEFIYAAPVMDGGEFSFFGRADYDPSARGNVNEIIAGAMLTLPF